MKIPSTAPRGSARPASRAMISFLRNTRQLVAQDLRELDRRLPKKSHKRAIICGDVVELYTYAEPYFYNFGTGPTADPSSIASGEKPSSKRGDHVLRARRQIRRLIDANVSGLPIFITYTFAKNVRTLDEANPLFSKHVKELQRRYGKLKYLAVPEFQKRGAVHYHVIYFDLPYIRRIKEVIAKLWPHGYSQVKSIRKVQRIGLYVAKYLQKSQDDARTAGRKSFFTSRNLLRPIEIRSEETVDFFLKSNTLVREFEGSFQTKYGLVSYEKAKLSTTTYGRKHFRDGDDGTARLGA